MQATQNIIKNNTNTIISLNENPIDIVKYFMFLDSHNKNIFDTNKLQILTYYAQAWLLSLYNECFFDEDFVALPGGGVCLISLFRYFKLNEIDNIHNKGYNEIQNINLQDKKQKKKHLLLNQVLNYFYDCDNNYLRQQIRNHTPWKNAYFYKQKGLSDIITKENIMSFYQKLYGLDKISA